MEHFIVRSKRGYYQMPAGRGHYFGRPRENHFARPSMMLFLMSLSTEWAMEQLSHPWGLGDVSQDGGIDPGHGTHINGAAVDIYILNLNKGQRKSNSNATLYTDPDYDAAGTLRLAQIAARIISRGFQCVQFLYDDPAVKANVNLGLAQPLITTRPSKPHPDHFHIQLRDPTPYTRDKANALLKRSYEQWFWGF
jgi:murein endopeptidase